MQIDRIVQYFPSPFTMADRLSSLGSKLTNGILSGYENHPVLATYATGVVIFQAYHSGLLYEKELKERNVKIETPQEKVDDLITHLPSAWIRTWLSVRGLFCCAWPVTLPLQAYYTYFGSYQKKVEQT
ncbi:MAG: hypothetical protein K0S74_1126 [Chlamydiales bacterium]|nr:hypothetical protein [Chlamydiales bacterium]